MKKVLAMTLALVLALGLVSPALADEVDGVFYVEGEPVEAVPISDEIPVDDDYDYDWGWDDWDDYDVPEEEPTLTLMVNGVASDATVTAVDGVSYVDAAALRAILGDKAVGADVTGPVAVRSAAQAAGWDVEWYGGGWKGLDQEIQLWDKHSFEAQLDQEFGPLNDLVARAMTISRDVLTSSEAVSGKETVDVVYTVFSTLDGNKDYKLKLTADYVVKNGVMDMTVTFDVAQLLDMVSPVVLARLGKDGAPTLEQLTGLLKAGKMEFILDYDRGVFAYNVPLLGLLDEDMKGWQTEYLYGWDEVKAAWMGEEKIALTSTLYASMVSQATYRWSGGAQTALEDYKRNVGILAAYLGKDRFTTSAGGEITYSLTTQAANRALGENLELPEPDKASFFKVCDVTYSLDAWGGASMKMHIRPDVEGIVTAMATKDDYYGDYYFGLSSVLGSMNSLDMDLTASGVSDKDGGNSQMKIHWNNLGTMDMKCQTTVNTAATRAPRKIEDVERAWVYRPVGDDPGGLFTRVGALVK